MASVTQIVISELRRAEDRDLFVEITREMVSWLEDQSGFLAYALYEDGLQMADTLTYESKAAAQRINEDFRETDIYRRLIRLVQDDYRGVIGSPVPL